MGEIEAKLHTLLTSAVIIVQSQRAVYTVSVVILLNALSQLRKQKYTTVAH
jgi:hypothetical protein